MGGNVFKELDTCRLDFQTYNLLTNFISTLLSENFKIKFQAIPAYKNKIDFGDLDILFHGIVDYDRINTCLNSKRFVRNGNVTSYAVPVNGKFFQVDLIKVPEDCYDFSLGYFSYNDLGNLLGRIYHRLGFKFGHLGLRYIVRDKTNSSHVIKEITITKDFRTALEFVGYDYKRWTQGFNTLEDVFKYAVSIPLANRVIFRLDEINHAARVRDRKRKTYNQFLTWVNDPSNSIPNEELANKEILREYFLKKAFLLYPKFRDEYEEVQFLCRKIKLANEKFNGKIVSDLTGLQGKELGRFMQKFISHIKEKFSYTIIEWTESYPQDIPFIENEILYFFQRSD